MPFIVASGIGETRDFRYCLKITNLKQHPNYLFFVQVDSVNPGLPAQPPILLQPNQCVDIAGYRPIATIVALPNSQVQSRDLEQHHFLMILKNTNLLKAAIVGLPTVSPPSELPLLYRGNPIQDSYQIQAITPTNLQLAFVSRSPQMVTGMGVLVLGASIIGLFSLFRKLPLFTGTDSLENE